MVSADLTRTTRRVGVEKEKMEGAAELLKQRIEQGGRGAFERVVAFVQRGDVEPADAEAAEFFADGLRDLGVTIIAAATRQGVEWKSAKQLALRFAHKATDGFVTFVTIAEELTGMPRERFEQQVKRLMSARQAELAQRPHRRHKRMLPVLPEARA